MTVFYEKSRCCKTLETSFASAGEAEVKVPLAGPSYCKGLWKARPTNNKPGKAPGVLQSVLRDTILLQGPSKGRPRG